MSDLFDYLDLSGPAYAYLGHFARPENIERGHNLVLAGQHSAVGPIPDPHLEGTPVDQAHFTGNPPPPVQPN